MFHLPRAPSPKIILISNYSSFFLQCFSLKIISIWTTVDTFFSIQLIFPTFSYFIQFDSVVFVRIFFLFECVFIVVIFYFFFNFCCAHTLFPCLLCCFYAQFCVCVFFYILTDYFTCALWFFVENCSFSFFFSSVETNKCTHRLLPSSTRRCKQ